MSGGIKFGCLFICESSHYNHIVGFAILIFDLKASLNQICEHKKLAQSVNRNLIDLITAVYVHKYSFRFRANDKHIIIVILINVVFYLQFRL